MKRVSKSRSAVSNGIFGAAVVVLIVVAAIGYGLYGTAAGKPAVTSTFTVTSVSTEVLTTSEMGMTATTSGNASSGCACMFTPKSGAMIGSAWFVVGQTEKPNQYAVSIHAEGLEPNGTYIVEVTQMSGGMADPISSESMTMNTTAASEFHA